MVFENLKGIIAELFTADEDSITEDTNLYDDLYADSCDLYELSLILEEEYDLTEADFEKMEKFCTVGEICDYITQTI
ncbi:MAG: acyl carrier protein [Oscillospiraceae bacterium]|nr:acyl carrier protein [Oscillospiraceae bacterium]